MAETTNNQIGATSAKQNEIDKGLLGALIRHHRQDMGYDSAEDFAEAITKKTGYSISKETIYKIESGRQEPKLSLYYAIARLLNPAVVLELEEMAWMSLPKEWKQPLNDLEYERSMFSNAYDENLPF